MSEMVEVVIDSIRVSLMSQQRIVILREVDAERRLREQVKNPDARAMSGNQEDERFRRQHEVQGLASQLELPDPGVGQALGDDEALDPPFGELDVDAAGRERRGRGAVGEVHDLGLALRLHELLAGSGR